MTLEAAQTIVYRELGIWDEGHCNGTMADELSRFARGNGHCIHGQRKPHEIEMPPLTDGLLAVILRRLRDELSERYGQPELVVVDDILRKYWTKGTDPVIAAVMAFAQYLEVRK